jgi:hypothetical protein
MSKTKSDIPPNVRKEDQWKGRPLFGQRKHKPTIYYKEGTTCTLIIRNKNKPRYGEETSKRDVNKERIQSTSIIIPKLRRLRKASKETNKDKRKTNTCNIETTPLTTSGIKKTNQKYPSNHKCTYD